MEFKHLPVMLNECINGLNIKPDGIYVDGTLGGGGHSYEILSRLNSGLLVGIDKDDDAIKAGIEHLSQLNKRFLTVKSDFKNYKKILEDLKITGVDGVLLDLGVSSFQLDNFERGFSYSHNAPLDMRMDKTNLLTAEKVVNNYSEKDLTKILYEYGEEPFTKSIVRNIINYRKTQRIETTGQLVDIIKSSVPKKVLMTKGHPAKRVFQAIRIEVNGELLGLEQAINDMVTSLNKGGRIAIITFHSLEDRIVKNAFKLLSTNCICPPELPICVCHHKASVKLINKKPILPSEEELKINHRSSSAKLRIAEKIWIKFKGDE